MPDDDTHAVTLSSSALPGEDGAAAFQAGGWNILVCRSAGRLFALENRCTHRDQKLEGGRVRRGHIFCPHHGARFALATGAACGLPASSPLKTFVCTENESGLAIQLPILG